MAHWNLIIEDDSGKAMAVPLTRDEVTIGRKEGNTIRLTERNVSRFHAKLRKVDATKIHIEDLGSYNGIKINGDRISGQVEIREGDLIEIGDYHLALQAVGMTETAPPERPAPVVANTGAPSPLSLQTTQGAAAEVDDDFAGDTQRWEPPVGMEPVAVGLATVDDQAAIADGQIFPANVSGIGSPTLDERPAISSTPGVGPAGVDHESTVRNQSAPLLPAPGTPLGAMHDDNSNDETEAIPVANSSPPLSSGLSLESLGNSPPFSPSVAAAAPVPMAASLASIEDEPTEAHPMSGSNSASGELLPPPSNLVGKAAAAAPAVALEEFQPNTLPEGSPAVAFDPEATLSPVPGAATAPTGTPAVGAPTASSPLAASPAPSSSAATSPAGAASAGAASTAATSTGGSSGKAAPSAPQNNALESQIPQTGDSASRGEYTDIVRAAPGPRRQQLDVPRLMVVNSVFAGNTYPLQAAELVIGRIEDNDITIEHRSVSRHHAKVVREGNGYRIVDLGSANGILLNGLETEGAILKSGDIIELGRIRVRFVPAGENFELSSEEIAKARKADALGEDDFDDGAQTAFLNTNAPAAVAESGNGSTLVILVAAALVIILLLLVIVFLLMRAPATDDDTNASEPAVAQLEPGDTKSEPATDAPTAESEASPEDPVDVVAKTAEPPAPEQEAPERDPTFPPDEKKKPETIVEDEPEEPVDEAKPVSKPVSKPRTDTVEKSKPAPSSSRPSRAARVARAKELFQEAQKLTLMGDHTAALAKALESNRTNPGKGETNRLLGSIYMNLNNKPAAKKHFKLAIEYQPSAAWREIVENTLKTL